MKKDNVYFMCKWDNNYTDLWEVTVTEKWELNIFKFVWFFCTLLVSH